ISQACDEAWRAAARCGIGLRRLARRRGHRPSAAPLHDRLATRPGAPPRAAASGYDVLLDVEAIDLLPPPRQQPTPRRPRSQIRIQVLERQGHRSEEHTSEL